MQKLVLLGAGGHARVVIEILKMNGTYEIAGVVSPAEPAANETDGVQWLGDDESLPKLRAEGVTHFLVAVGSVGHASPRRRLYERAAAIGLQAASAVHPHAIVSASASIGPGTVVMAGAIINVGGMLGENVIINTGAIVEHDCVVGGHAHVSTGARLCGGVRVGEGAHIGAGATVRQSLQIGAGAVVAAGAVVVQDVVAETTVIGAPARIRSQTTDTNDG